MGVLAVSIAHARFAQGLPGDFGPTAFFVLSGFLITRILIRARAKTGAVPIGRFYLGRTMRIFPAYYAFLLLSYLLDARAGQRWSPELLGSAVTYTVNYFNAFYHHPTTSVAHAWSLAVEEQFYLLWPLLFVILARRGNRALIAGLSLTGLAVIAWRSWLVFGAHRDVAYIYNAFDTRFDNLAIGCLLAIVVQYDRVCAAAKWFVKRSWFPVVTLALLLSSRTILSAEYHFSIGLTIDALLVAVLIVQILQLYQTRLWRWLEWPAMRYFGAISYPMYLYHGWGASLGRRLPGDSPMLEFVAGILATIVLGSASYYLIERPVLKLRPRRAPEPRGDALPGALKRPSIALAQSA
jgi:peptidoglycan/LPS O-acetylase OafA/YrhL